MKAHGLRCVAFEAGGFVINRANTKLALDVAFKVVVLCLLAVGGTTADIIHPVCERGADETPARPGL